MFWRFGGYANVSTIDNILEKENFTLEDLLDESDLIQELKSHNSKLVEYLRDQKVLEKLLEYVVVPRLEPVAVPDTNDDDDEGKGKGLSLPFSRPRATSRAADNGNEEEGEKKRNKYAFIAAEILSSDNWSIYEALMESRSLLRDFWRFLKRPVPLDPLQASYFTKVNESLFDKKTEDMLELLKSLDSAVPDMLKHVDCPMVMDLLLRIISLERAESGQGIVEWLYTQDVMPTLLSFLGPEHSWATQTSAGDFMKAIITVSANASQNEQTCIGPNELTRQLVSKPCVEQLIKYMLGGGNALTCGVGIIIEVIRKNNSDYDPDGVESGSTPSSRDPIYLGTLLRLFAQHVPDFMNLVTTAPAQKERHVSTFGARIEPLGFDRFKTCELMAELLHCSNMGLLNEVGSEEFIAARDAQRRRLRDEGQLLSLRGEDAPSTEDLAMRMSHSSPTDEGRRLEVTNSSADDDGFEEVTHGADEDSSHGVEELPEVPTQGPISTFLDKDEDDFVDEPLSSPRLHVREIDEQSEEISQEFEEPDLVVPPLSPVKKQATLSTEEPASPKANFLALSDEKKPQSSSGEAQQLADVDMSGDANAEPENAAKADVDQPDFLPLVPAVSESAVSESEPASVKQPADEAVEKKPATSKEMSPHPEDTPAPLFSTHNAPVVPNPPTGEGGAPSAPPVSEGSATAPTAPEQPAALDISQTEAREASIIVGHMSEPTTPIDDSPISPKPVVGDYLKMQFVEHRVVPSILGFFFSYPWNNFLHNVVYDIVQQVFNGPMDRGYNPTLAISLFEAADITNQIISGQLASEKSQVENKTRMGYMGHLTLIAEEVVKFTERHPPELLSETVLEKVMAQDWINYVEGALAETRERDNAILGGVRPEVAMSNRLGASSLAGSGLSGLGSIGLGVGAGSNALAEAGLNGGQDTAENSGNGGLGPFAISAGTLMSGFGSSSDEDEDEEQESEEDVNNEFRAYTDPLNANSSTSMSPPSIPPPPPPPPPLNIPPSRARLQLAARLAMNKRNAVAAANGGQEIGSPTSDDASGSASFNLPAANDRLRNPFADDEEDEDGAGSGSGSDDGEAENVEGGGDGVGGSAWNRGSWWRGVVRSAQRGGRGKDAGVGGERGSRSGGNSNGKETERFGDGRDDSDESDGPGDEEDEVDDEIEDEEFGDFAMPEVVEGGHVPAVPTPPTSGSSDLVSGIDPARERILVKPLPVHPNSLKSSVSPFGSLWPFSSQGFGLKDKKDETEAVSGDSAKDGVLAAPTANDAAAVDKITEEPVELGADEGVVDEDGKKIDRAIEAKRRTSIEDPDDDDDDQVDVGEEIIVGRSGIA